MHNAQCNFFQVCASAQCFGNQVISTIYNVATYKFNAREMCVVFLVYIQYLLSYHTNNGIVKPFQLYQFN